EVYEGGIRSPFLARWPGELDPGAVEDRLAAHIDVMPTILDAAGMEPPGDRAIDGRSLLPVLRRQEAAWGGRRLFIQSHRGDAPVRYHHATVLTPRWKLVNNSGFQRHGLPADEPTFALYDLVADPYAERDLAAEHPDVVDMLRDDYDAWFDEVGTTRPDNYAPPRIHVGTPYENPTVLTRQDWRYEGTSGGWSRDAVGYWLIDVRDEGPYDVLLRFDPGEGSHEVTLRVGDVERVRTVPSDSGAVVFKDVAPSVGETRLDAVVRDQGADEGSMRGVHQVEVLRTP
ncbi:MAG: sulfatase/phosphatase domain-containing protein, partial [Rhodothermales bacterium]